MQTTFCGVLCSLPSPSLKPACSGVELPAHSFCHAYCWNLRSHTRAPFYWTRDYSAGIGSPPPSFITECRNSKIELWSEWLWLGSVLSSARLVPLLQPELPSQLNRSLRAAGRPQQFIVPCIFRETTHSFFCPWVCYNEMVIHLNRIKMSYLINSSNFMPQQLVSWCCLWDFVANLFCYFIQWFSQVTCTFIRCPK